MDLPTDVLCYIGQFLSSNDLLQLWKTCIQMRDMFLNTLTLRRFNEKGTELLMTSNLSEVKNSRLLTTFKLLRDKDNTLILGKYYLESGVFCGTEESETYFLTLGNVHFDSREYRIYINGGVLFEVKGSLTCADMVVEALTKIPVSIVRSNGGILEFESSEMKFIPFSLRNEGMRNDQEVILVREGQQAEVMLKRLTVNCIKGPVGMPGQPGHLGLVSCIGPVGPCGNTGIEQIKNSKDTKRAQKLQRYQQRRR